MKMTVACLTLALLGSVSAYAEEVDCSGITFPKTVFFVNGMNSIPDDAEKAKKELEKAYLSYLDTLPNPTDYERCVRFDLGYNQNEDAVTQIFEAALQSIPDQWVYFWNINLGLIWDLVPDWYKDAILNAAKDFSSDVAYLIDEDLQVQIEKYRNAPGDYVFVAHSQGNFYANEANHILGNVPTFSIATPESALASRSPFSLYLTFEEDKVIDAVRILTGALEANAQGNCEQDWSCHKMRQAYLHTSQEYIGKKIYFILSPPAPL